MDFHSFAGRLTPLFKKHWIPLSVGLLGLIFFMYGLIALLGSSRTSTKDIIFEAGNDSAGSGSASVSGQSKKSPEIMVDIEGGVVSPGVYKLFLGARIKDVLILAGGLSVQADRNWINKNLNLAAKLTDGEKIYVPKAGDNLTNSIEVLNTSGKINLNSASKEELDSLPGVGPATAEKIIDLRPYAEINDLLSKKAVSSKVFEQIKEKIAVY